MGHDDQQRLASRPAIAESDAAGEAAMYRLMVENTVDLIIRYDANRVRTYVAPSSWEMVGYEPAEMVGRKAYDLNHPDDRVRAVALFERIGPAHRSDKLVFRVRRKDGAYIWVEALYRYLPEDGGVLSIARDITARKRAEEQLTEANGKLEVANRLLRVQAQQDGLTGLANRRCFDEVLDTEFRRAYRERQPLGIVMIDVDCFKSYNDLYGHLAGDECLRRISGSIGRAMRRPADLAARYGGEEIAVLLPSTTDSGAVAVAERVRRAVWALGIKHAGGPYGTATVSAGACSVVPLRGDDDPTELVDAADRALYRAKTDGRNRVRRSVVRQRVLAAP
jgi:diguanylate cyclase (GGDEF)-like protein/PAS domain S-box-containing protein